MWPGIEEILDAIAAATDIQLTRWVALDWQDGPREGFVEYAKPASAWYFRATAERRDDDLDDLLFSLAPVPADTIDRLAAVLAELGPPPAGNWIPSWSFLTATARAQAEQWVDGVIAAAGPPVVIIRSTDLATVDLGWRCSDEARSQPTVS